jgi:citrate/tricarballylate utilization protein
MGGDAVLQDTRRTLEICNACRYCEGFCAVFQAIEIRRAFADGEVAYLANLCHGCRACFFACQYAPPHPFAVNAPKSFAASRYETYKSCAWPRPFAVLFRRNGLTIALLTAFSIAVALSLTLWLQPAHTGPATFYAVIPWGVLVLCGGAACLFSALALVMGGVKFWRLAGSGATASGRTIGAALRDLLTLRYLGGGGHGCDEHFTQTRRLLHHAMFYGFLLCFAATCVATLYADVLGYDAPYAVFSLPVLLGTAGGVLLTAGTAGLLRLRSVADPAPGVPGLLGADAGLLVLLLLAAVSGLALLAWRATGAMGVLLAIHVGIVLALFLLLPYSRFVHAPYRALALLRWARERDSLVPAPSRREQRLPETESL